jgi:hypothetical protein
MTTATGLREITDDDLDQALERVLLPRLAEVLASRGPGHCVRVDDLHSALCVRLVRRLRDLVGKDAQIHVLGASPQVPDDVAVTGTKLVELRNPDAGGALRPVLLVFVPPGSQASAEDSFGVATFEELSLGGCYADLARRLLSGLPEDLRQAISEVFDVLDGEAGPGGLTGDGDVARARYLLTVTLNDNDPEAAGAAGYELGLIPDFELFADRGAVRSRVTLNARQVRILDRADRSVRQRVVDLKLRDPHFRARLADLAVRTGLDDVRSWTRRIVADSANWSLSFHRWPLPDAQPVQTIGVVMGDLPLPRAGDRTEHAAHPGLAAITGQPYLLTGSGGLSQLAVPFSVLSDPRQVDGLAKFVVELVSEDSGPTGVRAAVAVSTTARRAYRATLRRLRTAQLDPGWHYLRVLPVDVDGVPIPVDRSSGPIGHVPEESERFFVTPGDGLDEPEPSSRARRGVGVTQELRRLELAAAVAGRDWRDVECTGATWRSGAGSILEARFGPHGVVEIPISPVLVQAEQAILAAPDDLGQRRLTSAPGLPAHLGTQTVAGAVHPAPSAAMTEEFRRARTALMEAVRGGEGMILEGREVLALREYVLAYAEAYADMLARLLRAAERSDDASADLRDLSYLLRIDTIVLDHPAGESGTGELLAVSPTHPVRMLWLLAWAETGRAWAERPGDPASAGTLAETLAELRPMAFPVAVPHPDGRLSLSSEGLGPYWQICLPTETPDPATLLAQVTASLEVAGSGADEGEISGTRLADCVERYVRMHPYVHQLVLCAVNPGRGERLAEMLVDLERRPATSHLRYELRLFTDDPQAPGTAQALADLLGGRWGTATEAEAFQTPAPGGALPKLSVAVRPAAEFRSATSRHTAHLTLLFDAFSAESFGVGPEAAPAPAPVHGLVQRMVTEYAEDDDTVTWFRQPRHERPSGVADDRLSGTCGPSVDVTDLLVTLPAIVSRAAAAVSTGEAGTGQVPRTTLSLSAQDRALLHQAHRCSDWVVTVDRTLGVEYFDSPGSLRRPEYVIDFDTTGSLGSGHQMVISSRSVDELHSLLLPMLGQHGFEVDRRHAGTFFDQLRLLSGRLAFKIASTAANQRTEVLGLALARLYLAYQQALDDQVLVPLDSHLELYRDARRRADQVTESVSLQRTDLALFSLDARRRTIVCRLVEVKCYSSLNGVGDQQRVREQIVRQLRRSAEVLGEGFDPALHVPDLPDRSVRNHQLASLLRFHLGRAQRHGMMHPDAANEAFWLLDHLDEGYQWDVTRTGLIFDLSALGVSQDRDGDVEFHVLGRDVVNNLLEALSTDPVLAARPDAASSASMAFEAKDLSVPLLDRAGFRGPHRTHATPDSDPSALPSSVPLPGDVRGSADVPDPIPGDPADGPDTVAADVAVPGDPADVDAGGSTDAPDPADRSAGLKAEPDSVPVPGIVVGASGPSRQFGVLGETFGRLLALDLNETHTISLFGVQGGGKSYTLGSIIEAASLPAPPVNQLPSPLATIVFHYSPTLDYAPEFTSMVAANDHVGQTRRLRDRFGVEPAALSDVTMLVPRSQLALRTAEYPDIDVRPLAFASAELQARHWRFLMGAVGNQSTYVRQLKVIMRGLRDRLTLQALRDGVDHSSLSDTAKHLAQQRLDLAAEYIDDEARVTDLVRPGRMIIVDLRDDLIEKDEALGLFVVLMELFAAASVDGRPFNKLVVFDEAHKYIESPDLVASLVESVREMRHKGMSILVASQDPPSVPLELIELSDLMILHRFNSPGWLKHLQKVSTALASLSSTKLNTLAPGEAYVWSSKATDAAFTREAVKVTLRPRLTRHGGATRVAVAES